MELQMRRLVAQASRNWWLFLVTGIAWLIFGFIVLNADVGSVVAISTFAGIGFIAAGANELMIARMLVDWRWLHAVVGGIFFAAGVLALVRPDITFLTLASVLAWYLLFKGILDIFFALTIRAFDLWWLWLVSGIGSLLLGVWVSGSPSRSVVLLIVWVAAIAITRGLTELLLAFWIREIGHRAGAPSTPT